MCTDGGLGGQPDGVPLATWLLERWAGDKGAPDRFTSGRGRARGRTVSVGGGPPVGHGCPMKAVSLIHDDEPVER